MALESTRSENLKKRVRSPDNRKEAATVFVGAAGEDQDIDGLELSAAAQTLGVSVDDIWRQVRNGKLLARTERGQVRVYTDTATITSIEGLPPLPEFDRADTAPKLLDHQASEVEPTKAARMEELYPPALIQSHSSDRQEIALLIDHLSLAKEENREILRLTHESMSRLSEMTDKMLAMKDSVIASKEEQMLILKQRLTEQSQELRQALQEKEDLETLTAALQR